MVSNQQTMLRQKEQRLKKKVLINLLLKIQDQKITILKIEKQQVLAAEVTEKPEENAADSSSLFSFLFYTFVSQNYIRHEISQNKFTTFYQKQTKFYGSDEAK